MTYPLRFSVTLVSLRNDNATHRFCSHRRISNVGVGRADGFEYANISVRNSGQLQTAQDTHQIVNLTPCVSPARFKVLLQTQPRIESQDHTG
jgi:hypothetical protein